MKTTTRESLKGRMSVFAITMALMGFTLSGSTMALTGSLEDPVDPLADAEYGLEDLLGMNPSMSSTPVLGLTFKQIGVSEEVPVTLVDPGTIPDPIATLWTVNVTLNGGTFITAPSFAREDNSPCGIWRVIQDQLPFSGMIRCEERIHVADIAEISSVSPEFPDTGLRFCVYKYYVGLDAIPPEGEDDFGTELIRLPGLSENSSC